MWRPMGSRGRLTIPDVLYLLVTMAFMGALYPVFHAGLVANASYLSTGEAYLLKLLLPLMVLVFAGVIFLTARRGAY